MIVIVSIQYNTILAELIVLSPPTRVPLPLAGIVTVFIITGTPPLPVMAS
jgi:hypothetical protein